MNDVTDTTFMNTSPEYGITVFALSSIGTILATIYLYRCIHAYRLHHDQRAAGALGKSVGLLVMSVGLLISATGRLLGMHGELSVVGLALARGAFIVLVASLVLANVRPGEDD